jgi:hypothetical protein
MRTGWRDIQPAWGLAFLAAFMAASSFAARPGPPGPSVRMTVEVDWEVPPLPALPASSRPTNLPSTPTPTPEVTVTDGRIIEVQAAPGSTVQARSNGSWLVGSGSKGRSKVRLEAPLGSDLVVKVAGQTTRISLAALLEGPQRTPPRSGVEIGIERLPWDSIEVTPAEASQDGTVEPGSVVPLSVAFNVLTPEPAEVNLHCLAELRPIRGGDPIWRVEWQEVVATDAVEPARHPLAVAARGPEGTYVLEVKTSWEPLGDAAGTRLGRWVRRRRNPLQTTSATRHLTLAILGPQASATPTPSKVEGPLVGVEVDAIDLARSRGHRPSASGRSPLDSPGRTSWTVPEMALVDASLRDRLRGWINRTLADPPILAPADASGLAWLAVGLRVAHPERPHRLTLTVSGGHPASLSVAMVAGGGSTGRGRVVLDACVSGSPILEGATPATYSWPVWPDSEAPVLVLVNRGTSSPVQVGSIILTELAELPAAPASFPSGRSIGLHLATPRSLDRFGGGDDSGRVDPLAQARNLSAYLAHCGASTVVLPDGLSDRSRRVGLHGQADEDSTGPDRLDLLLRVLARRGATAWIDVAFEGAMPGLPAPDSPEASLEGLIRIDRRGVLDSPGSYQPIHPRVREAMARKVVEAVTPRKARANLAGVLIRLGPGSTLPGGPDMGLDDATFARFVAAAFEPGPAARVPGQGSSDPARFEMRARYVEGSGRLPWLTWRAKEVASIYSGLSNIARKAAPGAILALVTPGLEPGPAGDEARRIDLAGLGPGQAWRGVGLDLALSEWLVGEGAPVIFRGAGLSSDDLGHDLATSPELDEMVAARATRGVLLGVEACDRDSNPSRAAGPRLTACPMPDGPAGDELLGHGLAVLDPRRVVISSNSVAGQEERIRRFARVFASLPPSPAGPAGPRVPSGVVARSLHSGADTYLALANDTPYPILLETVLQGPANAPVVDLVRGIELDPEKLGGQTRLVLEMAPHGVTAIRIGSPEVSVASSTPHPGPAVLDGMKAQYDDLYTALKRLDRVPGGEVAGSPKSGLPNAGFEPDSVQLASSRGLAGWEFAGDAGSVELDRDRPHSGRGSLRLEALGGSASIVSEPFRLDGRSALTIHAWLRSDRPDARVRVRLDGQAAGRPYARQLVVAARGDWAEAVIPASQVPDGGLDSARLRFELLGSGRLWVDDVSVVGDALGESERLYARRDLTAALSAYREKRYADFARLSGSHWARHAASGAAAAVAGDRSGVIRTGEARPDPLFKLNR